MVDIRYQCSFSLRYYDDDEGIVELDYPESDDLLIETQSESYQQRNCMSYTESAEYNILLRDIFEDIKRPYVYSRDSTECAICLDELEYNVQDLVYCGRRCGNVFHGSCIDQHGSDRCPLCRCYTVYEQVLDTRALIPITPGI